MAPNSQKPHIRKALKLRTPYMMKKSGFSVVIGDGEADGKPFKLKPRKITDPKYICLSSYISDIRTRLDERRKRLFDKVQSSEPYDYKMAKHISDLQTEVYALDYG